MNDALKSERRIFRAAVFPIFAILLVATVITGIVCEVGFSPCLPSTLSDFISFFVFLFVSPVIVSAAGAFLLRIWEAEVLSYEGVETSAFLYFRHRLLPWDDVVAVRTFPFLKLICVRFRLASGRSKWILFFQRRDGELSEVIADLVSKDSLVWKRLNEA